VVIQGSKTSPAAIDRKAKLDRGGIASPGSAAGFPRHAYAEMMSVTIPDAMKPEIEEPKAERWELWIDRGGGFDILNQSRVTIGGPGGDSLADIVVRCAWRSRVATILRGPGGDCIELAAQNAAATPARTIPLSADQWLPLDGLQAGDLVGGVGETMPKLRYRRPSPLSPSAVLTVQPPHRLVRPIDATVLFEQTMLVGPEPFNHVRAESLSSQGWVMFRRDGSWWIRGKTVQPEPIPIGLLWRYEDWSMMIRER
jgi:hypothetical protein